MEVRDLLCKLLAASLVRELVVSVFAQAMRSERGHEEQYLGGKGREEVVKNALAGGCPVSAFFETFLRSL